MWYFDLESLGVFHCADRSVAERVQNISIYNVNIICTRSAN